MIAIDPRSRYNYTGYYILGLRKLFPDAEVRFDIRPFPKDMLSLYRDNNSCMAIIIDGHKFFIDADDKLKIDSSAYQWCDVYGKINVTSKELAEFPKMVSIGPSFGVTIDSRFRILWTCIRNFISLRHYSDLTFKAYLKDYIYSFVRRRPITLYERKTTVKHNYIFHASTLWYTDFTAENTNLFRGEFLKACQKAGLIVEGGLFYVEGDAVLAEMPDYPKYKEIYKDFIYDKRLSMDYYIRKTKESVLVFNTPSVCECHGWKLAEYLCMGKAIISTPLTRVMPGEGLIHGVNVHFVKTPEEIYDAVVKINTDEGYRKKLEKGAREYYEKWLAPEKVITRLLECAKINK